MMPVVYICHPLVGDGSPEWGNFQRNIERYLRFVAWAELDGKAVLSWVHHPLMYERKLTPPDDNFYLDRDCAVLARADLVYLCGPVAVSKGMRREKACAEQNGIPILHEAEWDDPTFSPFPARPLPS